MLVKDFLSKTLKKNTPGHVFGMSGANIEEFIASFASNELKMIIAKNENNAVAMAIGSFLKTKKIATVVTTSGGAILNIIPMIAEAFTSRNPCLVITGTPPSGLIGSGAFQESSGKNGTFDMTALFAPITCSSHVINIAQEIPSAIESAIKDALTFKRPAILFIPSDLWGKEINPEMIPSLYSKASTPLNADQKDLIKFYCQKFVKTSSHPPVIVIGNEVNSLIKTETLSRLISSHMVNLIGLPETKGHFSHNFCAFKGLIGIMGDDSAFSEVEHNQNIIFIGVQNNLMEMYGLKDNLINKNILCLNEFDHYWNNSTTHNNINLIHADLECLIEALYSEIKLLNLALISSSINPVIKDIAASALKSKSNAHLTLNLRSAMEIMSNNLPTGADLFIDAGNSGASAIHLLTPKSPSLLYISLGMGAMGNSIGAAIGSQLCADKDQLTFVLIGDGSFLISGLEIHTAIEYNLPIIFVIMNNNSHEMCKTREGIFGVRDPDFSINDFKTTHYANGFKALFPTLMTYDVNTQEDLQYAMDQIINGWDKQIGKRTCLLSVNISQEILPPFLSFKKKES